MSRIGRIEPPRCFWRLSQAFTSAAWAVSCQRRPGSGPWPSGFNSSPLRGLQRRPGIQREHLRGVAVVLRPSGWWRVQGPARSEPDRSVPSGWESFFHNWPPLARRNTSNVPVVRATPRETHWPRDSRRAPTSRSTRPVEPIARPRLSIRPRRRTSAHGRPDS